MPNIVLHAEPRTILGKKVAHLRREGHLPANIYGHNIASTAITVNSATFTKLHGKLASTTLLQLELPGEPARPVLVQRATKDPRSGRFLHVEFYQVNLLEKITASVAIVAVGQPEPVTMGTGLLLQTLETVDVSALPGDLPPQIEVDVTSLHDSHEGIFVRDLPVDRTKIEVKTPEDELVFKIVAPQAASSEDVEAEEAAGEAAETASDDNAESES